MYNYFMKLIVQIPCFNEEANVSEVIKNIPKKIKGIDEIKIVVIDDGSFDKTLEIAKNLNVDKIIHFNTRKGLAFAFKKGVEYALFENADILINIDGDNQYYAKDIEKLVEPILSNKCDICLGIRPINKIKTFSLFKKLMQKLGSFIVKIVSNADIKDAASGFRAFSKNALLKLNVFNNFTYTIETLIQAQSKDLKIKSVEIKVNEQKNRKSRLFKNNFSYIFKQATAIFRFFVIYSPQKFFSIIASILFSFGFILGLRFLFFFFNGNGAGHTQSLILCAIIMTLSFLTFLLAILGDLFSINRKILENIQYEIRLKKYQK